MANRWIITAIVCASATAAWSQKEASESAPIAVPARAASPTWKIPAGVEPRLGQGQPLHVRTESGDQRGELYLDFQSHRLVLLTTGELSWVPSRRTRPATAPSPRVTRSEMLQSLASVGLGDFQLAAESPYVFAYACSEGFYLQTRSVLTSLYPGVVRELQRWGLSLRRPQAPLVVVIMPDRKAFDAYKRMPRDVVAYYNQVSNHIVLYEDQRLADAAPEFALKEAAYTIAHEGVHQILANTGVQQRLSQWPMWISEGLPEYFCPLRVHSSLVRQGEDQLPDRTLRWQKPGTVNDLRMRTLLKLPTDAPLVAPVVQADELDGRGYAVAWGLVHYLTHREPDAFLSYLREVARTPPLQSTSTALFEKCFGGDFAGLEANVARYLLSKRIQDRYIDPITNQTHYVLKSVAKHGKRFSISVIKTTSPLGARKWKEQTEAREPNARISAFICRNEREADYQMEKVRQLGR